jgi:hypothetical protein
MWKCMSLCDKAYPLELIPMLCFFQSWPHVIWKIDTSVLGENTASVFRVKCSDLFSQKDKINVNEKQDHSKHNAIVTAYKNENINLHIIIQQDSIIQMLLYWLTFHLCIVLKISRFTQWSKIGFQLRERHCVLQMCFWCCSCQCHLAISYERRKEPTGRVGGRGEFNQKTLL